MLCALNLCQDVGNNHLSTDSGYDNYSCINFPFHGTLGQVYSSTNLPYKVILTKVIIQPTKKSRSVGPHKSIPKKIETKRNHTQKTRNSEVGVNHYMEYLQIPVVMRIMYHNDVYYTQTKTRRIIHSWILVHLFQQLSGSSRKNNHTSLVIYQSLVVYHILDLVKGSN